MTIENANDISDKGQLLFEAIVEGNFEAALQILESAKPSEISTDKLYSDEHRKGSLLFISAYKNPPYKLVQKMIDYGFDINGIDHASSNGFSTLIIASWNDFADTLQCLIDNNVNPYKKDAKGKTVFDYLHSDEGRARGLTARPREMLENYVRHGYWFLTAPEEITCIREAQALDRRITDVFNFEYGERITYTQIISNKTELTPVIQGFEDTTSPAFLKKAVEKFNQIAGRPPETGEVNHYIPKGQTTRLVPKAARSNN